MVSERVREALLTARRYLKEEILVTLARRQGLGTAQGLGTGLGSGLAQRLGLGPGLGPGLAQRQGLGTGLAQRQGPGLGSGLGSGSGLGLGLWLAEGPERKKGLGQRMIQEQGLGPDSLPSCEGLLVLLQQLQEVMDMVEEDAGAWYHKQVVDV